MAPGAGGGAGGAVGATATGCADVFFWKFNSRRRASGQVRVPCRPGAPLLEILKLASRACGVALLQRGGSTGAYEVQTDEGIWTATDNTASEADPQGVGVQRSLISYRKATGPQVRPQVVFRTWEQLDQMEVPSGSRRA